MRCFRTATPHAMLPIIPKTETRFWNLFRCFLFPVGAVSLFLCIVMAFVTAVGESAPIIDGREIRGVAGALVCLAAFPFVTLFGALAFASALYFDRTKMKRQK
jgi:hypothetical protein